MARENLKCIMCARVAFATGLLATIATIAVAQDTVTPSLAPTILPAPVGHRQPRLSDLPPSVQREEEGNGSVQDNASARDNSGRKRKITGERERSAVPAYDTRSSCQAMEVGALSPGRNLQTCINSEGEAYEQLKKRWSQFKGADKTECVGASKIGGMPSYVELLTCLEIAQDLERMRATSPETTGVGDGNDMHRERR